MSALHVFYRRGRIASETITLSRANWSRNCNKGAALCCPFPLRRPLYLGLEGVFGGQPVIEGVALFPAPQFINLVSDLANHRFPVRLFINVHDAPTLIGQDRIGFGFVVCHQNFDARF